MVWWFLLLPLSVATLCRPGHQFWNETLEKCTNCSTCPEVVLRPCQVHLDTQCGLISALDIDWSFLGRPRPTKPTNTLHHQHLSKTYTSTKHPHRDEESTENFDSLPKYNNKNSHPKFFSSEEKEEKSLKNSHHKKLSSEKSFSENTDQTPKKHTKHHHYNKKHTSKTHSSHPKNLQSHNRNKTRNHRYHRQKFKWTSSDVSRSFDSPGSSDSSELHVEDGHRWSFSETSIEHRTSSFTKSNGTKKHFHHHTNFSHPHKKKTKVSKSQKHHGNKQKLPDLQKDVDEMLVLRPESASQLKESETVFSSSFDSDAKNDLPGMDEQILFPKHSHKIGFAPSVSSAPFSATEEFIWDWQAVALALAVFACLLFFVVACVYSVHHARQWRRLKDHFEDFEAG